MGKHGGEGDRKTLVKCFPSIAKMYNDFETRTEALPFKNFPSYLEELQNVKLLQLNLLLSESRQWELSDDLQCYMTLWHSSITIWFWFSFTCLIQ